MPEDVEAIENELAIRLPGLLVELAFQSRYFARWFGELGPDRSSPLHILRINERLASDGKPEDLVVVNHGYDGDCVGLIRGANQEPDRAPIVYVSLDLREGRRLTGRQTLAPDFRTYLTELCLEEAPRSRVKSLRRKAKRLINKWRQDRRE